MGESLHHVELTALERLFDEFPTYSRQVDVPREKRVRLAVALSSTDDVRFDFDDRFLRVVDEMIRQSPRTGDSVEFLE